MKTASPGLGNTFRLDHFPQLMHFQINADTLFVGVWAGAFDLDKWLPELCLTWTSMRPLVTFTIYCRAILAIDSRVPTTPLKPSFHRALCLVEKVQETIIYFARAPVDGSGLVAKFMELEGDYPGTKCTVFGVSIFSWGPFRRGSFPRDSWS